MAKHPLDDVLSNWNKLIENFETSSKEFYSSVQSALAHRRIPGLKTHRIIWNEGGALSPKREYLRMTDGRVAFDLCAAPFGTGFFFSWWLVKKPASWVPAWAAVFVAATWLLAKSIWFVLKMFPSALSNIRVLWWRPSMFGVHLFNSPSTSLPFFLIVWGLSPWAVMALVALAARLGRVNAENAMLAIPIVGGIYRWLFAPVTYYRLDTAIMFRSAIHAAVQECIDGLMTAKGMRALQEDERKPIMRELLDGRTTRKLEPMMVGATAQST